MVLGSGESWSLFFTIPPNVTPKMVTDQATRLLVALYTDTVSDYLIKHHIDSYNQYVHDRIPTIIQQYNPYRILTPDDQYEILVHIGGEQGDRLQFKRPTYVTDEGATQALTPHMSRQLCVSYAFELCADVLVQYVKQPSGEVLEKWYDGVHVASIPILLRSDMCVLRGMDASAMHLVHECPHDPGAYFIIDGKEKVIVSQEKMADHKLVTRWDDNPAAPWMLHVDMRATSEEDRLFPKGHTFVARPSWHASRPYSIWVSAINITLGTAKQRVPLVVLFRALGAQSDGEILRWVSEDGQVDGFTSKVMASCFADHQQVWTQDGALQYLARFTRSGSTEQALMGLYDHFMPHAGRNFACKLAMLGHTVRDVIGLLASRIQVDRDAMHNKRVDVTGFLLTYITRDFMIRWRNIAVAAIKQEYEFGAWKANGDLLVLINPANLGRVFDATYIDKAMLANFKTNKAWAIRKNADEQEAVVQDLKRLSHIGTVSHLRRVHTPVPSSTKVRGPRYLHPTQFGVMCPCETPDGANIGLLKHLAMLAFVTFDCGTTAAQQCLTVECAMLELQALCDLKRQRHAGDTLVLLNSVWVGVLTASEDAGRVCEYLRLLRRNGILNCMVSISHDVPRRTINIGTEQGRCARPLLVVRDGRLVWDGTLPDDWWTLVTPRGGSAVYDMALHGTRGARAFEDDALCARLRAEVCPVEYVDVEECTTDVLVAMYARDVTARHTHCEIHPMTMLGWTTANLPLAHHNPAPRVLNAGGQSKQSIGVYATTFRHRLDTEAYVMTYPQRPLLCTSMARHCGALHLPHGQNLMVMVAAYTGYNQEDALLLNRSSVDRGCMSVTAYHTLSATEDNDDGALFYDPGQDTLAQRSSRLDFSSVGADGLIQKDSRVTDTAVLFAMRSKHADKSVAADKTVGGVVDRTMMRVDDASKKRSASVVVRDFRQFTVGDKGASRFYNKGVVGLMLEEYEMPFTAEGLVPDIVINAHAFPSRKTVGQLLETALTVMCCRAGGCLSLTPLDDCAGALSELGAEGSLSSRAVCYDPLSGTQMADDMHLGLNYYLRLKQQVVDKFNYRSYGPVENITRQPVQGRGNEGGLKIGEMERNAILAHGACGFLKESLTKRSDGEAAIYDDDTGELPGQSPDSTRRVVVPRAFQVFLHEMRTALGVGTRMRTDYQRFVDKKNVAS
jgi:DNA-directed RNA polymerase II subunit RPB2